jgi:hypothetical protein
MARRVFWDMVATGRDQETNGNPGNVEERVYHLSASLQNPRKMPFSASAPVPPIPVVLGALDSKTEEQLVCEILKELKENYGVKICTNPSFERGMATPVTNIGSGRIVLIGASHMSRNGGAPAQ